MMDADVDFDPRDLGGWSEVDDICDNTITVVVGDSVHQLRCENDAGHEPPCGTTIWWGSDEQ